MNRWSAVWLVLVVGCGDDGGGGSPDAPVAPSRPRWRDPALVTELASPENQGSPALRTDELEVIFARPTGAVGCTGFLHATRASVAAAFSTPAAVSELNTSACEGAPTFGPDGRELYFTRITGNTAKIFRATRPSVTDPFGTATEASELNIGAVQDSPSLSADGLVIVFTSGSSLGPAMDVYQAERATASDPFGAPRKLDELGPLGGVALSAAADFLVATTSNGEGLVVYLRSSTTAPFLSALPVTEIAPNPAFKAIGQPSVGRTTGDLYYVRRSDANMSEIWRAARAPQ